MRDSSSPSLSTRRLTGLLLLLLAVAVAWTGREIPGFGYAMLMDDDTNILFNPHLGELDGKRLWWMFTDIRYVGRYLPLGWLSFSVPAIRGDLSPAGLHVAGVAFHACNAILLFLCLRRLIGRFGAQGATAVDRTLAAGVGALLWAVHPLRIEPVAWCSGLLYVQGGFFALLTLYARLRELEARTAGRKGGGWFAVAGLSFLVSLLTYPVALFLPVALLVLDYCWTKKAGAVPPATALRKTLGWEWLLLAAMAAGELAVTIVARQVRLPDGVPPPSLEMFGLTARGFQAAYVWASYVWRTFWPVKLTPVMEALFEIRAVDVRIWAALPTLAGISGLAWWWRRTAPYLGICWLIYLFWMIPVLGLTEHPHTAADRYSYLIGAVFSLVFALGILQVRSPRIREVGFVLGGVTAATCAFLSVGQARIWNDPLTTHRYVLTRLNDEDLRNITLIRIAKLDFLEGNVRDGRAAAVKVHEVAAHIAGVARTWREITPPQPLGTELAASPLQEWPAKPLAWLHGEIAQRHLAEGRTQDALTRFNAAVREDPDFLMGRFRRSLMLAATGDARGALHDWLLMEVRRDWKGLDPAGLQYAAGQIATALRASGDGRLADALLQRAAANAGRATPASSRP